MLFVSCWHVMERSVQIGIDKYLFMASPAKLNAPCIFGVDALLCTVQNVLLQLKIIM